MKWWQRWVACLALLGCGMLIIMAKHGYLTPRSLTKETTRTQLGGSKSSEKTVEHFHLTEHSSETSDKQPGKTKSSPLIGHRKTTVDRSQGSKARGPSGPAKNEPKEDVNRKNEHGAPGGTSATDSKGKESLSIKVEEPTTQPEQPQVGVSDNQGLADDVENKTSDKIQLAAPSLSLSPSHYPPGWLHWWNQSEASRLQGQVVKDAGLFPPCKDSNLVISTYGFVEPQEYLTNSKNPCWFDNPNQQKMMRCLPYVYLVGVPECGAMDVIKRLRGHREVMQGTQKEYHWWEKYRFGAYDEDDPEATINVNKDGGMKFKEYLESIRGEEIGLLQKDLHEIGYTGRIFGDFTTSYFWDPQNWYAIDGNQGCKEPRIIVAQHIHHVFPDAKILMMFRHPTPRMYAAYMSKPANVRKTAKTDFHNQVLESVQAYTECFRQYSIRRCAYNVTMYRKVPVRLAEGMYSVFMADWLRVWPREQILLTRYEDYVGHEEQHMLKIFSFLGLGELDSTEMARVMKTAATAPLTAASSKVGDMLPETKTALDNFYQPFVQMLRDLLQDDLFLWKDVYQHQ